MRELKLVSSGEKAQKRENLREKTEKKAQDRQVGGAMPCMGLLLDTLLTNM